MNIYVFYGAGDIKLGRMADYKPPGWSDECTGMAIRDAIMKGLPALNKLTDGVKSAARQRGFLYGLDKRKLWARSEHSAFNLLLQSAGAIVMKKALLILEQDLRDAGLSVKFVGNFHDEFCIEAKAEIAEQVAILASSAITKAGQYFKLNCPLEGDWKVGTNWSETH